MRGPCRPWTAEEDALVRELWAAKHSAQQIAARFPDRSRNSIIGRAHRLGLEARVSPIKRAPGAKPGRKRDRRGGLKNGPPTVLHQRKILDRATLPEVDLAAKPARVPVKIFEPRAPSHRICQWIDGKPTADDSCKCGAPVYGGAWCEAHYARAYDVRRSADSMNRAAEYTARDLAKQGVRYG